MSSYRTIQVTPKEYELLTELHRLLMKVGTKTVEDKFLAGQAVLEGRKGKAFNVDKILHDLERNTLAKGAVAGLAIALLLHVLEAGHEGDKR